MQKTHPRIKDVAQAAGVSTATVSRALTQPDLLNESTRTRVFDAIRATGYRVNKAARNLRTRRAGAVLVLVPNLGNPFFSVILSSISEVLAANGYAVLVLDSQQPNTPDQVVSDYLFNGSVDGLITLDGNLSATLAQTLQDADMLRNVVFCCEWSDKFQLPSIRSNNPLGAALAVDHLVSLGHRKIAHVTGPAHNILAQVRRAEFLARCAHHGLEVAPDWIIPGDFSLDSGGQAGRRLMALIDRPTGVFCASDEIAFGLISHCQKNGLRVPDDLSVVGFDDLEIAGFLQPPLTTIRQDRASLGHMAAQELLQRLQSAQPGQLDLVRCAPVQLITRGTTAAAR
jgi:LacI family transcriptional regulator, repressor for deo operon, udp, cdd, tsx, nupC, and nupG